jgi:hypothetical protein
VSIHDPDAHWYAIWDKCRKALEILRRSVRSHYAAHFRGDEEDRNYPADRGDFGLHLAMPAVFSYACKTIHRAAHTEALPVLLKYSWTGQR